MASLSPMKLKLQSKSYSTIGFHKESGSMMLDSMFQSQAKSVVLFKDKLIDDIDAAEWLKDVGFPQYTETFIANLSYDGRIILRSRLSTVRLQDLSKMNIINFDHQKQLMNHINYILKNPFSTILRQRQLQQQLKEEEESVKVGLSPAPSPAKTAPPSIANPNSIHASAKAYPDEKKESSSSKNVAPAKELPPPLQTAQTSFRENKESNTARSRRNSRSGVAEGSLLSVESKSESFDAKEVKEGSGGGAGVGLAKPVLTAQEKAAKRKEAEKRRRSFDSQIWNSISSLRNKQSEIANAAENLRSGIAQAQASFSYSAESRDPGEVGVNPTSAATPLPSDKGGKRHRRRWSFGSPDGTSEDNFSNNHQKAQAYGNMALEYDMMISSLKALQSEILFKFRKIINCEKASIFFINDLTRELVLFADDGKWYRLPSGSGIAGYCVETGETVNIPDAYADDRFNKNIDLKTGFRTRNILAKPVRRNRGGGNIVAVIEMMNKADGADFASEDEDILGACVENVADLLSNRFQELVNAGERFSGSATFIMGRNASVGGLSGGSSLAVEIEDEGKADDPGPGKVRFKE